MTQLQLIQSVLDNAQMLDIRGVGKDTRALIANKINEVLTADQRNHIVEMLAQEGCEERYHD